MWQGSKFIHYILHEMSFNYHVKFTCGALLKNIMSLRVRLFVINANVPIDCNRHTRVLNAHKLASGSECQREMRSLGRQPVISEVQFSESGRDLFYKWLIKTMRDEVSPRDWQFRVYMLCICNFKAFCISLHTVRRACVFMELWFYIQVSFEQ